MEKQVKQKQWLKEKRRSDTKPYSNIKYYYYCKYSTIV